MKSLDELCAQVGLPDSLRGNLIDDRYMIKKTLGRGGFGFVYLAEHEIFGHPIRDVAFKLLKKPDLLKRADLLKNAEQKQREILESFSDVLAVIKLARVYAGHAALKHLVYIYDAGICEAWDNRGYVVMECIAGDLQKEIGNHPKGLPVNLALDYAKQICRAMTLAHKLTPPVVHRDLKPPNVLIDKDGTAKVTDFGLAKAVGGVTGLAAGAGDFYCQAPESLEGHCSPASDVYSIGLILHEMLTGNHAFEELRQRYNPDEPQDKQIAHHQEARKKPLPDVATPDNGLKYKPDLCEVVRRGLSYSPSDRYRNAAELLEALEKVGELKGLIHIQPHDRNKPDEAETPLGLLQQATICEQRQDYDTALEFLERLFECANENRDRACWGQALFLSGAIKAKKGKLPEAQKELFRAHKEFGYEEAGRLRAKLLGRDK